MRLADKVQDWINKLDWNETVELDEENQSSELNVSLNINDQSFRLWVETDEENDLIKLYLYSPFNSLSNKYEDCIQLFNRINSRRRFGAIFLLQDGRIVFRHIIDVENTEPSIEMIANMLGNATGLFENWFDEISSVALTKKTAQEIFDELDKPVADDNVPDAI
jgi:hypothetical protein